MKKTEVSVLSKAEWELECFFQSLRDKLDPPIHGLLQAMAIVRPTRATGVGPDGNTYGALRVGSTIEIYRLEGPE